MKIKLIVFIAVITFIIISCNKTEVTRELKKNFLKFEKVTAHVSNKKNATAVVKIQADVAWKLSAENPPPNWLMIDKYSGLNSDSFIVTTLTENTTGGYKFAKITATAINNDGIAPVFLTVVQYDSTVKIK